MANRLVIAVDFGTTYSGVAYADALPDQKDAKVQLFTDWPGALGRTYPKAPSRISYGKPPGNEIQWGYEIRPRLNADVHVHALMKLNLDSSLKHSKQLKLLLALMGTPAETFGFDDLRLDAEHDDPEEAPPDYPGKTVVDIIADYLTKVRKAAFKRFAEQYPGIFHNLRKELVVTVPAVWSERAKDLTLKAVERADFKADAISLVPEPEAAAVYTLTDMTTGVFAKEVNVGDMFVVCDAGGGTVDLISYKICSPGPEFKLEEAAIGSGDKCGSSYIDKEFVSWLEKWLGTAAYDRIPKRALLHGSKFLNEFELLKYDFSGKEDDIEIRLPRECGITDNQKKNIDYGTLAITNQQMKSLFDPCVYRVMELIDEQVAAVLETHKKTPKMVMLVGGFGRSEYLFKKVEEYCLERDILPVKPKEPWSAVVRGAVLRGLEPPNDGFITVRLARRHYGTFISEPFIEGVHLEEDAYYDRFSGKKRARGQMKWLLEKGSRLPEDIPKSITIDLFVEFGLDEDKSFTSVLVSSDLDIPPIRYADESTRNVCRVGTDLNDVPLSLFCRCRHRPTGPECYQASFKLETKFTNNQIEWRSLFGGEEYGKVHVAYER